jgi:cobalt-zinc-cadmium efflux system protein
MAASHDHGHEPGGVGHSGHNHGAGASSKRLGIALALTTLFLIAEIVGAVVFDSLALLSDAAHMFTDSAALAIALAAVRIGQRPPDDKRTFGYRRFEILAAAFNAILLFAVAGYVLVEGIGRFFDPRPVESAGMLAVAAAGLVINLISMRILAGGRDSSLNVKGAYLEVWADMLGSLGVIGAAIAIYLTGYFWIDPVVAIAIGLWVLPRTWILLRDTTHILLQGVPRGYDLKTIRSAMLEIDGVGGVHDLHLWSIAGDDASLTAHIVLADDGDMEGTRQRAIDMLEDRFDIRHATIQTEAEPCGDGEGLHD